MKRVIFALMLWPFVLTSCSTDTSSEGMKTVEACAITFDVKAAGAQTRSEVITPANFASTGRTFKIWAWMTNTEEVGATPALMTSDFNSNPMNGIDVIYSAGAWTMDPTYGTPYWPRPKYRLDCYAVYPKDVPFNTEDKTIDYSSTAVGGNNDVMFATFTGMRENRDNNEKSRAVSLTFNHIMSQIQFKANKSNELSVTITSLEICNVNSKGVFTLPAIGSIGSTTPSWGSHTTLTNYSLPLKATSVELTSEAQSLNATDGMLMLIPQTRTKWDVSQTITVNDGAGGAKGTYLKIGCSVIMGNTNYADNGYIYFPIDINWEAGKNYTYTLGFGTGYDSNGNKSLQDIYLSSHVTDWIIGGTETNDSDIYI